MPLIVGMSVLLGCQFIGELLVRALAVPVPGPVLGMVVLLIGLMVNGRVPSALRMAGEGLLRYLTLLFVPAGPHARRSRPRPIEASTHQECAPRRIVSPFPPRLRSHSHTRC